jgi:hypothetical protein
LLMRFTLPAANKKGTEDVDNLVADLDLCSVTDEFGHGSSFSDVVLESADELLVCFHSVYIGKEVFGADEDLGKPESTAGVSEYTVSVVATGSSRRCTFIAGKGDLKCFLRVGELTIGLRAYCVVAANVLLVTSTGSQPKSGRRAP